MQAYAEGFDLFDECEFELDNAKIAHLWMQGSVVRSWLCELAARAFEQEGNDLARARAATSPTPARAAGRSRTAIDQRRPDAGDHRLAVRALLLARPERRLRGEGQRRAARPVRRPRRCKKWPTADGPSPTRREPAGRGARAAAGPPHDAGDLRRDRRPGPAQAAAGDLQPRPRGRAARALLPDRRARASRQAPRGLPRRWRRRRSTSSRAASPTRRCSTRCSSTCATCRARSTTPSVYDDARRRRSTSSTRRPASR